MPWESSRRRKDPPGWSKLRQEIINRAQGQCEHPITPPVDTGPTPLGNTQLGNTQRCPFPGRDVDHIINVASGGSNEPSNLQLLCEWHHKQKTQAEAKKAPRPIRTESHPREKHPGVID